MRGGIGSTLPRGKNKQRLIPTRGHAFGFNVSWQDSTCNARACLPRATGLCQLAATSVQLQFDQWRRALDPPTSPGLLTDQGCHAAKELISCMTPLVLPLTPLVLHDI